MICLSINGFMCCSLVGKEGVREEGGKADRGSEGGSVWVMLALDVYENFLKGRRRSHAVAGGRKRWAPP